MEIGHNLPRQLTSLIGRDKEIEEITALIHKVPLVTLTGPGGVGKTSLALEVAHSLLTQQARTYPEGIWLVELASTTDQALVPHAVATALKLVELHEQSITDTLVNLLRHKQALIVLDNCEHVIDACARLVEQLLRECDRLKIIATSREPLKIAGENVWPVPSLPQKDAVELFATRASEAGADFRATPTDAKTIARLCDELDGLPLAIELAAACVRTLSLEDIAGRLSRRFDLLVSGRRTAPQRQQSLRAMVEWSIGLLPAEERTLFARLSVFAGGWTLDAAEAICGGNVLGPLQELVYKSLVVADARGERTRFRLLETLRQYAAEELRALGEEAESRTSHLEWFAGYLEHVEPELSGANQLEWDNRLESEHANIRAALAWAGETGSIAAGLRLASALRLWWGRRGHLVEGCHWLEALLANPEDRLDIRIRVKGHNALAYLRVRQGNAAAGRHEAETALRLAHQAGMRSEEGEALLSLAQADREAGELDNTERRLFRVLDIASDLHDARLTTNALIQLGWVLDTRGLPSEALERYAQALDSIRRVADPRLEAFALHRAASAALEVGQLELARQQLTDALRLRASVTLIGRALAQSAGLAAMQGKAERACRLAGTAIGVLESAGAALHQTERDQMDQRLTSAREQLGMRQAAAAFVEGRSMRLDAAVAYALEGMTTMSEPKPPASKDVLSLRELQVAELIRDGLTNAQIADRLVISQGTAKRHVENIMSKLGVHSRAQIVNWLARDSSPSR